MKNYMVGTRSGNVRLRRRFVRIRDKIEGRSVNFIGRGKPK